ncbi:hypothetical protein JCM8547_008063 [Rhodosporidiobolus lusitaniae]
MIPPKWSRNTLLACCLVYKSISERAGALLWRHVDCWDRASAEPVLAVHKYGRSTSRAALIRSLHVDFIDPLPLLACVPRLKELALGMYSGKIDLPAVAKAVPVAAYPFEFYSALFPLDPGSLIHQLDIFQLHTRNVVTCLPPSFLRFPVPTLVTVNHDWFWDIEPDHLAAHLQVHLPVAVANDGDGDEDNGYVEELVDADGRCARDVRHLVRLVQQASLSSLHIPYLRPELVRTSEAFEGLLETCDKKSVEVVYFNPEEEEEDGFSWSFWRYAKKLKARRAVRVVEG